VAIVAEKLKLKRSTYEILQLLGISLLDKTAVTVLFTNKDYNTVKEHEYKQLNIRLF